MAAANLYNCVSDVNVKEFFTGEKCSCGYRLVRTVVQYLGCRTLSSHFTLSMFYIFGEYQSLANRNLFFCDQTVMLALEFSTARFPYRMCLVRLGKEGDAGNFVSKAMKRIFVQDMRDRMGMFDQMSSKVTRQNRNILDGQFLTDILSYEEVCIE